MRFRTLLLVVPVLGLFTGCVFSAPLTITFGSSLLTVNRGQTATFTATVTNTTAATLFLNGDSLNIAAPLTANDTKFFLNFPVSMLAGQIVTAQAFDISFPLNAPFGLYPGEFDILGGATANSQTMIGSAVFAVASVPEPGTFGFALAGLGCTMVFLRAKRRARR